MDLSDLRAEVFATAEAHKNGPMPLPWLVNKVACRYPMEGPHADVGNLSMMKTITEDAREYFRRLKAKESEASAQLELLMPGCERLQARYVIQRRKVSTAVPLMEMTQRECIAKCTELEAMRDGLNVHVEEFRRFIDERFGVSLHAG